MTGLERLTPEQTRAREAVRQFEAPPADAAFRARLEHDFTSGRIAAGAATTRVRSGHPMVLLRRAAVPLAAAAALLAVSLLNRGPAFTLGAARGDGIVVVDGVPVPMTHREELARRMRAGARARVPDGVELEIASPGYAAIQLTGGTDVALPASPGRWFGRTARLEVRSGELRITTGPRFHGARLEIETPEAAVTVTGTTLAVICEPAGTCVCVLDGRVAVGRKGESGAMIDAGHLRYVFNDSRPPASEAMRPTERVTLAMFRDAKRTEMEAGAK